MSRTASPHVADLAMAPPPLGSRKALNASASNSPTPYSRDNNRSTSNSPSDDRKRYHFDAPDNNINNNNNNPSSDSDALTPTQTSDSTAATSLSSNTSLNPSTKRDSSSYLDDPAMDPSVRLEAYDWPDLESQFARRMEAMRVVEEDIWEEWRSWGEIFGAWASTISVHDEERAGKRLRTRIAFTQGSEEGLEGKRCHYIKVVQAFESALALLGGAGV